MCTVVACCIVITFLFTVSLRHLYQGGKIKQLEWDMSTVTAGDYAVELKISSDAYRNWYNHEYYNKKGSDYEKNIAPAHSLTRFLTKEIEDELTQQLRKKSLTERGS